MSAICPLSDEYLPIDAGSLKNKQVIMGRITSTPTLPCLSMLLAFQQQHQQESWRVMLVAEQL